MPLPPSAAPPFERPAGDPAPLPYLNTADSLGGINLTIEVWLRSAQMVRENIPPMRLSRALFAQLYWTAAPDDYPPHQ